jgi:hypothetical protein
LSFGNAPPKNVNILMHQKIFSQAKDDQVGKPMKPGLGHEHKETGNVKNIEHGHGVYILYILIKENNL